MNYFKKGLFIILTIFCTSAFAGNSGKSLNLAELQKLLVAHTYPLGKGGKGGMYFSSANKAIISWEGKTENVNWYAANDSKFCFAAVVFGGKEECIKLTRTSDGNYIHDYYGKKRKIKASSIRKGKTF